MPKVDSTNVYVLIGICGAALFIFMSVTVFFIKSLITRLDKGNETLHSLDKQMAVLVSDNRNQKTIVKDHGGRLNMMGERFNNFDSRIERIEKT